MADPTIDELEAMAGEHTTRQASEVASNWPAIVNEVREREVIVANENKLEAVVMSVARYLELQGAARANGSLQLVRAYYDLDLRPLRAPGAEDKLREIFGATPQEIADAANGQ